MGNLSEQAEEVDRQARQICMDSIGESQVLDAAQVTDGNAADNEDGGETGGITGVMETNVAAMGILMGSTTVTGQIVGSGIVNTEIETRGALGHRQGRPKPANWKLMTKRQRANWYKRENGEDEWTTSET